MLIRTVTPPVIIGSAKTAVSRPAKLSRSERNPRRTSSASRRSSRTAPTSSGRITLGRSALSATGVAKRAAASAAASSVLTAIRSTSRTP
jgi:hypothetical protein